MRITENELPYEEECIYPFAMYAEYEDGNCYYIYDRDEDNCMVGVCSLIEEHGYCEFYSGVTNEDRADGEWVGRENFIYD